MQALSRVRRVPLGLEGQPERRERAGGGPDARRVLTLGEDQPPAPPGGGCPDVVTNGKFDPYAARGYVEPPQTWDRHPDQVGRRLWPCPGRPGVFLGRLWRL